MKADWQKHHKQIKEGSNAVISPYDSNTSNKHIHGGPGTVPYQYPASPNATYADVNAQVMAAIGLLTDRINDYHQNIVIPLKERIAQLETYIHSTASPSTPEAVASAFSTEPDNGQSGPPPAATTTRADALSAIQTTLGTKENGTEAPGDHSQETRAQQTLDIQGLEGSRSEPGSTE